MILIGLGSNMGDRYGNIVCAMQKLDQHSAIKIDIISSLYETKPVGVKAQPDFLNGVIGIHTVLSPMKVLQVCLDVERQMGRLRQERWGPRNIDIDLLMYDDVVMEDEVLTLPHPRLHERCFVLIPLQEIAGHLRLYRGLTAGEWLEQRDDSRDVILYRKMDLNVLQI